MDTAIITKQILPDATLSVMPGKVAVVIDEPEDRVGKEQLILKPDSAKGESHIGTVIDVSEESWIEPGTHYMQSPKVKVGDRVVIGRYTGVPIDVRGQSIIILRHHDILATLRPIEVASGQDA